MQPQDNDFPIDQIKTDASAVAGAATDDAVGTDVDAASQQPTDQSGSVMGGTTFQPQANPTQPAPTWQQDSHANLGMLNTEAPAQILPVVPAATLEPAMPLSEPSFVPPVDDTTTVSDPVQPIALDMPLPETTPAAPPLSETTPVPLPTTPPQQPESIPQLVAPDSTVAVASPSPLPLENTPGGSLPAGMPTEPQPPMSPDLMPASYNQPVTASEVPPPSYASPSALPGADQLAPVAAGLDTMGSYGPPPKKSKKLIFIIIGVVLGLAIVGGGVYYFAVVAKKPSTVPTPTPTPTPAPTPAPTPRPNSGPATPPEGYATITKQCYSFALYVPNAVPNDATCTFAASTFGKKAISTIAVETKTESYQKLDDYLATFVASVTVISKKDIMLDGLDATQIIYKAPNGRTYSIVALLLVGKNYQQDSKTVTVVAITTSYQDEFDKTVTNNVLDSWRWQ